MHLVWLTPWFRCVCLLTARWNVSAIPAATWIMLLPVTSFRDNAVHHSLVESTYNEVLDLKIRILIKWWCLQIKATATWSLDNLSFDAFFLIMNFLNFNRNIFTQLRFEYIFLSFLVHFLTFIWMWYMWSMYPRSSNWIFLTCLFWPWSQILQIKFGY